MLLLVATAAAHVPFARGTTTITEIHTGPAEAGGQWFEVRNDSSNGQNLIEQVFTDADGDTFEVALGVIVQVGESAVFASEDSTVAADYHFDAAFDLRAESGAVSHTDLLGVVDEVVWDTSWGISADTACQVSALVATNEWANDLAENWCATAEAAGTPAADNTVCAGAETDDDGDGYTEADGDCADADAGVHPGASDHGDGLGDDADCDGERDEDGPGDSGGSGADTGDSGDSGGSGDSGDSGGDTSDSAETGNNAETGPTGETGRPDSGDDTARADSGELDAPKPEARAGCWRRAALLWFLALPAWARGRRSVSAA